MYLVADTAGNNETAYTINDAKRYVPLVNFISSR